MGQRLARRHEIRGNERAGRAGESSFECVAFPTALGWIGLLGRDRKLVALTLGHVSRDDAVADLRRRDETSGTWRDSDWDPELRRSIERFCEGEPVDLNECDVELPAMTPFQRRVIAETRKIGYGETATYADLARRSGAPGAARAVGNVMRSNRIPLVIPCHRIVGSNGLGGYSAPQGLTLKRTLLTMESEASPSPRRKTKARA